MGRKKKEIVWHKRKSRFIEASVSSPRVQKSDEQDAEEKMDRHQRFAKSLSEKIKKAVQQSPDDP